MKLLHLICIAIPTIMLTTLYTHHRAFYKIFDARYSGHHIEKRAHRMIKRLLGEVKDLQHCCNVPQLLPRLTVLSCTNNKALGGKNTFFGLVTADNGISPACFAACVFKELNVTDDAGKTDLSAIPDVLAESIDRISISWSLVANQSLSRCQKRLEEHPPKPETIQVGNVKCPRIPIFYMTCVRRSMIANCPSVTSKPFCLHAINNLRNKMRKSNNHNNKNNGHRFRFGRPLQN